MQNVSIVILNYNNSIDTINCIKSIQQYSKYQNQSIVVVDNCSKNGSIDEIENELRKIGVLFARYNELLECVNKKDSKHSLISLNKNYGYAKGNNFGIKLALNKKTDYLLILNNDVLMTSDIIPSLINFKVKNKNAALISPLLFAGNGDLDYRCARKNASNFQIFIELTSLRKINYFKKIIKDRYILNFDDYRGKDRINIDLPSGSCMFCDAELMVKIDGFDENTFLYYEENILFEKIKRIGLQNVILPKISAVHLGAKSTILVSSSIITSFNYDSAIYYLKTYRKGTAILTSYLKLRKVFIAKYLKLRAA